MRPRDVDRSGNGALLRLREVDDVPKRAPNGSSSIDGFRCGGTDDVLPTGTLRFGTCGEIKDCNCLIFRLAAAAVTGARACPVDSPVTLVRFRPAALEDGVVLFLFEAEDSDEGEGKDADACAAPDFLNDPAGNVLVAFERLCFGDKFHGVFRR